MFPPRPNSLLAFFVVLVLSTPTLRADPFVENPLNVRQYVNGVAWQLTCYPVLARGDAYMVWARIDFDRRYGDREFTLLPGGAVVELTRPENPAIQTHVLLKSDVPKVIAMDAGGGIDILLDLRHAFGALEPGRWVARFILHEGQYRVQGHKEFSEIAAEYPFEIVTTTKQDAARHSKPTTDVVLDVPPPDPKAGHRSIATLTNRTGQPIEFGAAPSTVPYGPTAFREPLDATVSMVVDRFVPPFSWRDLNGVQWCGTGSYPYQLAPGQTVRITIHSLRDAQLMRARLS